MDIASMRDVNGSQVDTTLLRSWLDSCERSHGTCSGRPSQEDRPTFTLLLIDVKERRLVEASSSSRYLALSYVWGGTS